MHARVESVTQIEELVCRSADLICLTSQGKGNSHATVRPNPQAPTQAGNVCLLPGSAGVHICPGSLQASLACLLILA